MLAGVVCEVHYAGHTTIFVAGVMILGCCHDVRVGGFGVVVCVCGGLVWVMLVCDVD